MNLRAVAGVDLRLWSLAWALAACSGGSAPAPQTAAAAPSTAPAASSAAAPPVVAAAEPSASEPAADSPPPPPKTNNPDATREVKYVATPEGLKIEVAGVRFLATAQAKQVAKGWGVKISVKAETLDGKQHVLLNPKNGPIAFAAAVFKKGSSEAERIADAREGNGELELGAGSPASFSREFPNKGGRVLAIGETLDMEVALWGLGTSADDRRPVKQFVHVKMKVEKGKPKPIVEPPASASR